MGNMLRAVIILHSPLSLSAALEALRNNVDEERWTPFSWSGYGGELPLLVRFRSDSIRIRKRIFYNNGFARQFYGRLIAETGGTRIEGYFAGSVLIKCFMGVWWGFLFWGGGRALIATLLGLTGGSGYESNTTGNLLLMAMGTGALVLMAIGSLLSRPGEKFILEELREILAVEDDDRAE
jgi:hypothetical protein